MDKNALVKDLTEVKNDLRNILVKIQPLDICELSDSYCATCCALETPMNRAPYCRFNDLYAVYDVLTKMIKDVSNGQRR